MQVNCKIIQSMNIFKNFQELEKYFVDYKNDPWHSKYPGEHAESWSMVSARIAPFIRNLNTHFLELLAKDPIL